MQARSDQAYLQGKVTTSHIFGEIVWLLTQSPGHQKLPVEELTWQIMPPIARRQFHLFREGERPIGAITWARLDDASEAYLSSDKFHPPFVTEGAWSSGDKIWIIDFIAPFASEENKHRELMLADLIAGPFRGIEFSMLHCDPVTKEQIPVVFGADTVAGLIEYISTVLNRT